MASKSYDQDATASTSASTGPAEGMGLTAAPHPDEMDDDELDEEEVEQEGYESSSSASTTTSTLTWITWFCSLPGHEYFCEVAEDFIEDDFNLTGLSSLVPFYKEAMEMVLDVEAEEEAHRVPDVSIVESSAELLYGLIHQRYIITRQGLQQMYAKYEAGHFGNCPRVYCSQTKLLPCGRSDLPGVDTVKLYCPSCVDMYVPPSSRFQGVDGAFFGTTFPHLLFQTYPSAATVPSASSSATTPATEGTTPVTSLSKVYIPKIYGFKVSEKARSGPRMQWLRMRPRNEAELDWADSDRPDVDPNAAGGEGGGDGQEKQTGKFDSGPDDEEEDDEDVSEEEDGAAKDAAASAGASKGDEAMNEAAAASAAAPASEERESRSIRPMPRTSFGASAPTNKLDSTAQPTVGVLSLDAASVSKSIEAAVAGVARPPKAVLASEQASGSKKKVAEGMVTAVKLVKT